MKKLLPIVCVCLLVIGCTQSENKSVNKAQGPAFDIVENQDFNFKLNGEVNEDGVFEVTSISVKKGSQTIQTLDEFESKVQVNEDVIWEDLNFDGYDDIRLMQYLSFNSGIPYYYWLFNPKTNQFERNINFEKIVSPRIDTANQQLISQWTVSKAEYGNDFYQVNKDQSLKLVRQEIFSVIDSSTTKTTKALVNHEMVIVTE